MSDRPKFFDDLAGVAGGAISALAGMRDEAESMIRARLDDAIRALDLVRRDEVEALTELAANARAGQEAAESQMAGLLARLTELESRVSVLESAVPRVPPPREGVGSDDELSRGKEAEEGQSGPA